MFTNRELLSKKRIQKMVSLPTITLTAEEADRFIDYIVDQSILKNNARIERMNKPTKYIRALGFGEGRFLKPADTFAASDYKKEFAQGKIELTSKKARGCVVVYDDDLEDNIEGQAFADHLMKLVAQKIAHELEEVLWISDTQNLGGFASTDLRSKFDGWRYRMTHSQVSTDAYYNAITGGTTLVTALDETNWGVGANKVVGNVVEPTTRNGYYYVCTVAGTTHSVEPTWPTTIGSTVTDNTVTWRCQGYTCVLGGKIAAQKASDPYNWEFKYGRMLEVFPSVYKTEGLANLRFWNSDRVSQNYVDALSARSTILGDNAILGTAPLKYGKVAIVDCPLMPCTLNAVGKLATGSYTDCLLTPAKNLIWGIQREIKIESQREAADEATYWFYSIRMDVAIENVAAAVLLERLVIQ